MKRVALLCPVHRRADLIRDQIASYGSDPERSVHLLHPSCEGALTEEEIAGSLRNDSARVEVATQSYPTAWNCIFGAFIALTKCFRDEISSCASVYLHTDADLMLTGDFNRWAAGRSLACTMQPLDPANHWAKTIALDQRFSRLRAKLGIEETAIVGGRQEGALLPVEIWFEAIGLMSEYYDTDFYANPEERWPIEEWVLPTVIRAIAPGFEPNPILVRTREITASVGDVNPRDLDQNCMTVEEVERLVLDARGNAVAAKWFSQDYHHGARTAVRALRGVRPLLHPDS